MLRDLLQEAGRHGRRRLPEQTPLPGVRQEEPFPGARHAHVQQTALLLDVLVLFGGARMREEVLLQPGDEDDRELQSLGRVQGHQADARAPLHVLGLGQEGRAVEKGAQAVRHAVVGGEGAGQLLEILDARGGVPRRCPLEVGLESGALDDRRDEPAGRLRAELGAQVGHQAQEGLERARGPSADEAQVDGLTK